MDAVKWKVQGRMSAVLKKANGVRRTFEADNLVVDSGIDFIAAGLAAPSGRPAVLSHIGVGTSTTPVDNSDTALGAEISRQAATYDHDAGSISFILSSTFDPGEGTGDITEAGVFNASSSGTMFNRVVFSAIPKEADDSLDISFTFTFTPT